MFFLSGLLYSLMANFVSAVPIAAAPRDVFDPLILTPTTGTVWTIGSVQNVTWSTADAPQNISNGALVVLAQGGRLFEDTQGGISEYSYFSSDIVVVDLLALSDDPLAQGFDLRAGFVEITVPDVTLADNYEIVCE